MIIKTNTVLKNLKGVDLKNADGEVVTLGEALGNVLLSAKEQGKMKLYVLAQKCANNKSVEVDEADLALVKRAVSTSEIYGALVLGQCEILLDEVKEEVKKGK